jgi:polyphenol oxidase
MPGSDLNGAAPDPGLPSDLQSPVLARAGFRHAFFTRRGGASEGPFESLSFSTAVGDRDDHVEENLRRAGARLGVSPEHVVYLSQVHGDRAYFFDDVRTRSELITLEGDAVGGRQPATAYGVRSADCVPILIADEASGSVMAVHAGWRGVVGGVVEAGVARLRQSIGGAGRLVAAIGPHLSQSAFEVSVEVADQLVAACPGGAASAVAQKSGQKPHVDLRFIVTQKLLALGLGGPAIDQVHGCTLQDSELFFSFRRDGKRSGRHLSAIVPRS